MKEGSIFARARDYLEMLEIAYSEEFPKPPEFLTALTGLAQAEAALILANSNSLLADVIREQTALERIQLGLGTTESQEFSGVEPLPTDSPAVAKPWDRIPSMTEVPPSTGTE